MKLITGVDLSMRSTGIVAVEKRYGSVIYRGVIKTTNATYPDNEDLIINVSDQIVETISNDTSLILIEGLSLNAKSANKDVIAGLFWTLRIKLREAHPHIPIHIIPVSQWRKFHLSPSLKKKTIRDCPKASIKDSTFFGCVPVEVQKDFFEYIEEMMDGEWSDLRDWNDKKVSPKDKYQSVYDLCDAYLLALYGKECIK